LDETTQGILVRPGVLQDTDLSPGAKLLDALLLTLLARSSEDTVQVKRAYLAERMKITPRTVDRYVEELQRGGHLQVNGGTGGSASRYRVLGETHYEWPPKSRKRRLNIADLPDAVLTA
jgi:predicted ArsR family transcriptional regulator